jgi:hypothetical protein
LSIVAILGRAIPATDDGYGSFDRQNPDDPVSYLSALLALIPQALCVIYVTLIWASREVEVLLMFAGQMLSEALNFTLKRIILEERPPRTYSFLSEEGL